MQAGPRSQSRRSKGSVSFSVKDSLRDGNSVPVRAKATRGRVRTPKACAKPGSASRRFSHEVLSECDASSHRFWEAVIVWSESHYFLKFGQNVFRYSTIASFSGAESIVPYSQPSCPAFELPSFRSRGVAPPGFTCVSNLKYCLGFAGSSLLRPS